MRRPPHAKFALHLLTIAMTLAASSCTETDLVGLSKEAVLERSTLFGQVCAPPDLTLDVPYRVLFVIDTSLSNEWSDPQKRRVDAVRNAINANIANTNVSFGVITFSDVPRVQTLAFTRDLVVLGGATKNVAVAQGATNYSDTMWVAKSFILEDLNAMPALQAARTRYLVFWLTDGFPTVGTTDPASLLQMAATLRSLLKDRVQEFRMDTAFLGAKTTSVSEEAEAKAAKTLLEGMSQEGGGRFIDIPLGQAFNFEIDPTPMRALFQLESLVVTNRNLVLGPHGPTADSDADGLSDVDEEELGLSALMDDTDGDGYRDGVEWFSAGRRDPLVAESKCDGEADLDADGLKNCEEQFLGTLQQVADTDQDGLMDGHEVLMGASAVDNRSAFDRDEDGVPDQLEVRMHLRPSLPTTLATADQFAYGYQVHALPKVNAEDPGCYDMVVENLALVSTRSTKSHAAGVNAIDVLANFSLEGGVEPHWARAQVEGRLLLHPHYVMVPANNKFELTSSDFKLLPR
jgi:uncharacterized protein YegL